MISLMFQCVKWDQLKCGFCLLSSVWTVTSNHRILNLNNDRRMHVCFFGASVFVCTYENHAWICVLLNVFALCWLLSLWVLQTILLGSCPSPARWKRSYRCVFDACCVYDRNSPFSHPVLLWPDSAQLYILDHQGGMYTQHLYSP